MFKSADEVIAGMDTLVKSASDKLKATYWVKIVKVHNVDVKDYEEPHGGSSGRSGKLIMRGVLYVQPDGYSWTMEIPFQKRFSLQEDPRTGLANIIPVDHKDGLGNMVTSLLIHNDKLERQVLKMLGEVETVYAD